MSQSSPHHPKFEQHQRQPSIPRAPITGFQINQNLPKPYQKSRYYTQADLQQHAQSNNLWVVLFSNVLDLTPLV